MQWLSFSLGQKNSKKIFDNWYLYDDTHSVANLNRPAIKVKFYLSINVMHDFFCFKDRVPGCFRARVVYKYACSRCNSVYVTELTMGRWVKWVIFFGWVNGSKSLTH